MEMEMEMDEDVRVGVGFGAENRDGGSVVKDPGSGDKYLNPCGHFELESIDPLRPSSSEFIYTGLPTPDIFDALRHQNPSLDTPIHVLPLGRKYTTPHTPLAFATGRLFRTIRYRLRQRRLTRCRSWFLRE
ncbi:hypothetical protein D9757_011835 [Collybiopsis confluens]|uniref:Uncharacterized protein n=1 Tax=Collybiopsis confluens TaxID=2823264 RepID=A0A8H5LY78_9AGAR|nr:hypothetical protein D9757_011835 [Collybiopsis confluens]